MLILWAVLSLLLPLAILFWSVASDPMGRGTVLAQDWVRWVCIGEVACWALVTIWMAAGVARLRSTPARQCPRCGCDRRGLDRGAACAGCGRADP